MSRDMTNTQIAELLRAIAASYQLEDESKNRFRIIAYQRAADAVEHASSELKDIWDEKKLDEVPGIGKSIAKHLGELFETGKSKHFEELTKKYPSQMFDLMQIPGVGAKTAYKLVRAFELKISEKNPVEDLEKLAKQGKIAKLEGFGEESQKDILSAIKEVKGRTKRHLLPYASKIANDLVEWLVKDNSVEKANPLGSLRRRASTVGDIDIAVASEDPRRVIDHFVKYPNTQRVLEKGNTTASIIVQGEVQVDLMVQPSDRYGALLQHFTGSKHHNIALREYALKLEPSLSLSEYGVRIRGSKGLVKFSDEKNFYKYLGLEWIPPELRENTGEIEAAKNRRLPNLINLEDVKADLQIHSDFNIETSRDIGKSSIEEIIEKASKLGYEYLALTEHNPSRSKHKDNQILNLIKRKKEKIDEINYSLNKANSKRIKYLFNSLEIDIRPSGELAIPEKALEFLDFALVSIHSSFKLSKKNMTNRILRALDHPKVKIFAHPTARKLLEREGIEVNWEKIFEFCVSKNKWLEVNADPMRLDLPDFLVIEAVKYGVKISLGTDAHHVDHMDNMQYAVSVTRRGWAEKEDIINTRDLENFKNMIK